MDLKGQKRIADLVIRDFEMDSDLSVLYEIAAASDYESFCLWGADWVYTYPPDLAQMKRRILNLDRTMLFAIVKAQQTVGFAELSEISSEDQTATLSRFVLAPQWRGKGVGSEAIRSILSYARDYLKLQTISLVVYQMNQIAQAVYKKSGFTEEGILIRAGRPDAIRMKCTLT